jgi:regulator of replication initiation timing
VSGVHGFWWTLAFLVLFGVSLVAGIVEGAFRFRSWIRSQAETLGEVETENKRLETERGETLQENEELKQENEELIAELENPPDPLPDTLAEWLETIPLITVPNQTYRNDRIELDGFHYSRCVFEDCTFSFRGTKPFRVAESCTVRGVVTNRRQRSADASLARVSEAVRGATS